MMQAAAPRAAAVAMLVGAATVAGGFAVRGEAAARAVQAPPFDARVIARDELDGTADDLLSAGLGLEGLQRPAPPGFADPLRPTVRELRRRAIWNSWRGLIDLSPDGGVGRLFGPRPGERIAGLEILGSVASPEPAASSQAPGAASARSRDAVLLQVPRHFDPADPCVVVVASSGSRGIFGALPTAAEWGLRRGCAVITSDKGTGNGFFDVDAGVAWRLDGVATTALDDPELGFLPPRAGNDGAAAAAAGGGVRATPAHRILSKHAHGGVDPEPRWGERLLRATESGFAWLNEAYRDRLRRPLGPGNTRVIASGISNGGAVVLRALELDRGPKRQRWFDAAVVAEPNAIVTRAAGELVLERGGTRARVAVRGLLDYATLAGLLQPCALLAPPQSAAPLAPATAAARAVHEAWCADLAAHGEVAGADVATQALDARRRLLEAGIEPLALQLGPLNHQAQLWPSIAATYVHAHAAARADEAACGLGFAAVDANGRPRALADEERARLAADGTGIPPTAGIALVRDDGGPPQSPSTLRCLRAAVDAALRAGPDAGSFGAPERGDDSRRDTGVGVPGTGADFVGRLRAGLQAIQMRADPGRRPVVLLHGRDDGLIPVNHSSRPWYAAALRREPRGELRYYELPRVQHFDAFLSLPGFAPRFLPMQPYLLAAMDLADARLRRGAPLPPSQVLRSRARAALPEGGVAALDAADLGVIAPRPAPDSRITLRADGTLVVPD